MKNLFFHQSVFLFVALSFSISCQHYVAPAINNSVNGNSVVLVKAAVKIAVGGIVYENLDANVKVTGYNSNNVMQWTKDYNLIGPEDTLAVQNGFHHYSIEMVDKWGVNDIQSEIPAKDIWDGRVDGPLPVTYVLGGSRVAKKLSKYVTSRQVNTADSGIVYQPESRTSYTYDGDHVAFIHHETYNLQTLQFEETSVETFTYDGNAVSKIITTLNGQPYLEHQYEYGTLDKITENNHNTGIVTIQLTRRNYLTNPNDSSVSIDYSFSNGMSIIYDFGFLLKNIVNDRTRQSGQVCNLGKYTYDKNINPFKHLGYIDFNLQNWSANNKLSEDVNYMACAYPTVIPLFYNYTYDQDGYPVKKITKYKAGLNQNTSYHTSIDFFYE
jgi:hypothetical protein